MPKSIPTAGVLSAICQIGGNKRNDYLFRLNGIYWLNIDGIIGQFWWEKTIPNLTPTFRQIDSLKSLFLNNWLDLPIPKNFQYIKAEASKASSSNLFKLLKMKSLKPPPKRLEFCETQLKILGLVDINLTEKRYPSAIGCIPLAFLAFSNMCFAILAMVNSVVHPLDMELLAEATLDLFTALPSCFKGFYVSARRSMFSKIFLDIKELSDKCNLQFD